MQYVELKDKPVDPNRAKWYALLLCAAAALIALMTVKSNYDYFAQYYQGFGFWMRVIPFVAVEIAIITLPLTKGWGNLSQQIAALICEVVLIALSLTHTSLVGQASQAKIQAGKTKAEAQADYDREQAKAEKIAAKNQELQDGHNRAMARWNRAAILARRAGQQPPPAPASPQLMTVPQIDQQLIADATLSTERASEAEVSHALLLRLLYAMIAAVIASAAAVVWLADASRIKAWLLRQKADKIREATTGARVIDAGAPNVFQFPSLPFDDEAQAPKRIAGFAPQTLNDTQTPTKTSSVLESRCLDTQTDCQDSSDTGVLKTLRARLKMVSGHNPGMSFKVDTKGPIVFVRAMKAERGRQTTASTVRLSEAEAWQLASKSERDCQRDLVSRFQSQNFHLNF